MSYPYRKCHRCDATFMNQNYGGLLCSVCLGESWANAKKRKAIWRLSFLFFPIGFLLHYLWKDKKPELAGVAWEGAMLPVKILGGLLLLIIFIWTQNM